jgi:hypothetical protein
MKPDNFLVGVGKK